MWHLDLHLDDSIQGQFTSFYFILSFSWMIPADSGMFKTFFWISLVRSRRKERINLGVPQGNTKHELHASAIKGYDENPRVVEKLSRIEVEKNDIP